MGGIKSDLLLVLCAATIFTVLTSWNGNSFAGDAAAALELKEFFLNGSKLENISFAAAFRGDAPVYPYALSLHALIGLEDTVFALFFNGVFNVLTSVFLFLAARSGGAGRLFSFLPPLLFCLNSHAQKFLISPISQSLNLFFTAVFLFFSMEVLRKKPSWKIGIGLGLLASIAFMNNYAFLPMAFGFGLLLLFRCFKGAVAYGLVFPVLPMVFLVSGTNKLAQSSHPGSIFQYPIVATFGSLLKTFVPYEFNYWPSLVFGIVLLGVIVHTATRSGGVALLLGFCGLFSSLSLLVYLVLDGEALINIRRGMSISLALCVALGISLGRFQKRKISYLATLLLLGFYVFNYAQFIGENFAVGPKNNSFSLRTSEIMRTSEELMRQGQIIVTNNPVVFYSHVRIRPKRSAMAESGHAELVSELERYLSGGRKVYFVEFKSANKKYKRIVDYGNDFHLDSIIKENELELVEFRLNRN